MIDEKYLEEMAKGYVEMGELNSKLSECDEIVSDDIYIFKKKEVKEVI